jgi:hypothetical protein
VVLSLDARGFCSGACSTEPAIFRFATPYNLTFLTDESIKKGRS